MAPEERVARANDAKRILNDPMVVEAFASIERAIYEKWSRSLPADTDGRESCHRMLQGLHEFRNHFQRKLEDGRLAQHDLDRVKNG